MCMLSFIIVLLMPILKENPYFTMLQVNPSDVIILEGILIFHDPSVRELMNMKIFVDTGHLFSFYNLGCLISYSIIHICDAYVSCFHKFVDMRCFFGYFISFQFF